MAEMKEGLRYIFRHREIRFVVNMLFVLLSAAGAVYVVIIVFIQQTFQSITKDLGVLAVCLGVGLFAGTVGYGKWGKRFTWYNTIFFCLFCGGIMMMAFALVVEAYPNISMAGVLAASLGIVVGPIFIASNTIVHLVSDERMRGKVFSLLEMVIHCAFLVSMGISVVLSKFVSAMWILVGVGVLFACVGLFGFLRYKDNKGFI